MKDKGDTSISDIMAWIDNAPAGINDMGAFLNSLPPIEQRSQKQQQIYTMFADLVKQTGRIIEAGDVAGIDWTKERENFLNDTRSLHTRRAYSSALGRLEAWANREGIKPLTIDASQADQFIRDLKAEGLAAASTRRDIAAVSAFYSFLERYHKAVRNPIRGTRIRPPKENAKKTVIPTAADYSAIIAAMPPIERAIIETLARRGLRAGALPTLERKAGLYHGKSKGKVLKEGDTAGITLPPKALKAIKAAGLDPEKPFAWINAAAIERRINYRIGQLYQAGKIKAAYSAHDFRHYYAIKEYGRTKDIYRVSMLLNHENVAITQTYLKTLGIKL